MGYFTELRDKWRPLTGALIGMASGLSMLSYPVSSIAPHMIEEFGWSRAEFALIGSLAIITCFAYPLVGRLADIIGVRKSALFGIVVLPLLCIAITRMNGDVRVYAGLFLAQTILTVSTTAMVYGRIVVQHIKHARGLALAIVASGPPLAGAILGPLLNDFIELHGWREGYVAFAIYSFVFGIVALLLIPSETKNVDPETTPRRRNTKADYALIAKTPAFWVIFCGLVLCTLPIAIALSQLKLVMMENGVSAAGTSAMIGALAAGTLIGRFICGLAIDRFPAHIVAAISLALPSIGLLLIASSNDDPMLLTGAVFLYGLSYGAEGDLIGYLVVRNFGVGIYSTVVGLMTFGLALSSALSAGLASLSLSMTSTFTPFLIITAISVLIGSALFLLLGRPGMNAAPAAAT